MEYLSEIISFVAGLIGGSLITLKFKRGHVAQGGGSVVDQRNARATGDVVGRDKN
jgi:hypothetical protein